MPDGGFIAGSRISSGRTAFVVASLCTESRTVVALGRNAMRNSPLDAGGIVFEAMITPLSFLETLQDQEQFPRFRVSRCWSERLAHILASIYRRLRHDNDLRSQTSKKTLAVQLLR
jgi:hypothetical protein